MVAVLVKMTQVSCKEREEVTSAMDIKQTKSNLEEEKTNEMVITDRETKFNDV